MNLDGHSTITFTVKGFLFPERLPFDDPYDYFDFKDKIWFKEELRSALTSGILPEGMILAVKGYVPVVVVPDVKGQKVVPIIEAMA
jgi:hypothetical protein